MPIEEKKLPARQHLVSMENRMGLKLTGIVDIDSFDEQSVVAYTDFGELVIRGSDLHISLLNVDSGDLQVEGTVQSLTYLDQSRPAEGLLARLFR